MSNVLGTWRIIDTEVWSQDDLDLVEPACLRLEADQSGSLRLIAIQADVDYRVTTNRGTTLVEFSFAGNDDGDQISGRGSAILEANELRGKLFIHRGDESAFIARRDQARSSGLLGATHDSKQKRIRSGRRTKTR